jgi:hypothetical protein
MTAIAQQLDEKLKCWNPETARQVEHLVEEIIQSADQGILDLAQSRSVEQEVLDLLNEP